VIVDFEMNKACAAGTGSFLEEQAEKLAVEIKGEFARRALAAPAPCRLGERCTVFMENSLMDALQRGASTDDLLAGLAYSIVENYVNRVVAGRPIGERVFFQGGTAFNKAVVAAFEKYLGRPVVVPPHHDVTGAIGMARIAREQARAGAARSGARSGAAAASSFKGFDLANRAYEQTSFECKGCENRCEINTVRIEGEKTALHFGGRCEKWDQRARPDAAIEDLFAFRAAALNRAHEAARARLGGRRPVRGVLGIPRIFFFHDFLPLYATIFWELGFRVEVSPETNAEISSLGVRATLADTCYPVKAALGHVRWLAERGADAVFLPSFVNMAAPGGAWSMGHACPLTQSFPYQARTAFPDLEIIAPVVRRSRGRKGLVRELRHALSAYGVGDFELARAVRAGERAQRAYEAELRAKGCEVETLLASGGDGRRTLLVVGRPYNAFDPGMNLDSPRKLARLGVRAVPMDLLPLEPGEGGDRGGGRNGDEAIGNNGRGVASDLARDWPEMYWRSGQRILAAARAAHRHPALGVLFVGNFSCGPDSFILQYFRAEMAGRPFLHVEIDEHSADAGAITRCEAFLDSLDMLDARAARAAESASPAGGGASAGAQGAPVAAGDAPPMGHAPARTAYAGNGAARTVYLPRMCDHSFALRAAFESCGVKAVVMDETDDAAMALARRYVTGKECYPFAVTVADMLRQAAKPDFDPGNAAFFMPGGTGPCRFGQYNVLQRMILERAGLGDVPLYSPSQDVQFYRELGLIGSDYARRSWEGLTAVDLLLKCLHETRPYEAEPGAADRIYAAHLARLDAELPRARGAAAGVLASARAAFAALARNGGNGSGAGPAARPRPLVGIVGEIFVRSNRFSNENLVRRVEELGGEAWLSPVDEWVYYVNWHARDNAKRRGQWRNWLALTVRDRVQRSWAMRRRRSSTACCIRRRRPPRPRSWTTPPRTLIRPSGARPSSRWARGWT
jgi:predicted nucleotide-binding protein (sugar kinase/HSP70/actin superfamily)